MAGQAHAAQVGAVVPFFTYEGEKGLIGGGASVRALKEPAKDGWSSPELEASGRAFVELKTTGAWVAWQNTTGKAITALDVRYSVPDTPQGGGLDTTLNLYVDGVLRQAVPMSSKQNWLYEGTDWNGMKQDPAAGNPHVFYEETHFFITGAPVPPGGKIAFRKDAKNDAAFYWIDCIDLETPPPPLKAPANSLDITTFGAVPNDPTVDSTQAIRKCIDEAQKKRKSVWVPPGTFYLLTTQGLNPKGITFEGAGMWYSTIYRKITLPVVGGGGGIIEPTSCIIRNLCFDANSIGRPEEDGDCFGINIKGENWVVDSCWVQHTSSGAWCDGTNGVVRNCRMLSTWGDGVNLNNGNSGNVGDRLIAENNYVRGAGDDGVTINDDISSKPMESPILRNNTTVAIWWADGLRVAGGKNVLVENNLLCDPAKFPGIIIGTFNGASVFSATIRGNVIVRGGGNAYKQQKAAFTIGNDKKGADPHVENVVASGNLIIDSMMNAVEFESSVNITFQNNTIDGIIGTGDSKNPARAIRVEERSVGSALISNNILKRLASGQIGFVNNALRDDYKVSGTGNVGFTLTPGRVREKK
jgi:hypothetical protein